MALVAAATLGYATESRGQSVDGEMKHVTIWSANLTAELTSHGADKDDLTATVTQSWGYWNLGLWNGGRLSDADFTLDGTTYTVKGLTVLSTGRATTFDSEGNVTTFTAESSAIQLDTDNGTLSSDSVTGVTLHINATADSDGKKRELSVTCLGCSERWEASRTNFPTGVFRDFGQSTPVWLTELRTNQAATVNGSLVDVGSSAHVGGQIRLLRARVSDGNGTTTSIFKSQWFHVDEDGNNRTPITGVIGDRDYDPKLTDFGKYLQGALVFTDDDTFDEIVYTEVLGPVFTVPNQPENLTATPSTESVALSWTTGGDNGSPITGYQVRYRKGSGAWTSWTTITGSSVSTTSHTVEGLDENSNHTIEVRAVNAAGPGVWAQVQTTTLLIPRAKITGVSITSDPNDDGRAGNDDTYAFGDSITLEIAFDKAIDVTQGAPQLRLDAHPRLEKRARCTAATNTTTLTCTYTVQSGDLAPKGLSIPAHALTLSTTTIVNAGTTLEVTPQVPAHAPDPDHKVDGVIPSVVTSGNEAPGTNGDGSRITLYTNKPELTVGDATTFTIQIGVGNTLESSGTATSTTVSGRRITLDHDLTIDDKHKILLHLTAGALEDNVGNVNVAGVPVFVHNNVAKAGHPSGVRNLKVHARNQEVQVSWDRPIKIAGGESGGIIAEYQYRYRSSGGAWSDWAATHQQQRAVTVTDLDNGTEYEFQARAKNHRQRVGPDGPTGTATPVARYRANLSVWGIRRGGGPTKATLTVTNGPFDEDRTYTIHWNGQPTNQGLLHSDNPTTVTLPAGHIHARGNLRAAADDDGPNKVYNREVEHPLVYKENGTEVVRTKPGDLWDGNLSVHDNEEEPSISLEMPESVLEGNDFHLVARMTHRLEEDANVPFSVNNPSRHSWTLTGVPDPPVVQIPQGELEGRVGPFRKPDNDEKDGVTKLGFLLAKKRDDPWKLHGSHREVYVDDDETPESERRRDRTTPLVFSGDNNATEGDEKMTFGVSIHPDPAHGQTVTVDYRTEDGSAKAGVNYVATSGRLTFVRSPNRTQHVEVDLLDDGEATGHTHFWLVLENVTGGGEIDDNARYRATIYDESPKFVVDDASAAESGDGTDSAMEFRVELRFAGSGTTTVDYRTEDGTARAGADYTATSGTLTFGPGTTSQTVQVAIKDDSVEDDGETFSFILGNPTGEAEIHASRGRATGTILNTDRDPLAASFPSSRFASASHKGADDRPQVIVAFSEAVAAFTKDTPSVGVTGGTVSTVQVHTEDGLEHAHIFFLDPSGDDDVTFTLIANEPCDAGGICTAAGTRLSEVPRARTIPGPGGTNATPLSELSVNDVTAPEGEGGLAFLVRLDPATTETVTVDYATSDGSARAGADYTATNGTLSFAPGETSKTVTVAVDDDAIEETDETLTLTLSNAPRAEIKDTTATGTIEDDDEATEVVPNAPTMNIAGGSGTEGDDEAITFTVTLEEAAANTVTVDYATADGTAVAGDDYTATSGTLRFSAGTTTKSIAVAIADDSENESDETFSVTLSNPSGANLGTRSAAGTIRNRRVVVPSVSIAGGRGKEGDDDAITFTVTLGEATSETVSVDYATADGTAAAGADYTATSGTVRFSPGTTSQALAVAIADDIENESDETFTVTLSNASGGTLATSSASGTIENRYVAPLTARFEGMPAEHDGTEFTFELHFSENPELPYRRLRDRSFTLVAADVIRAKRQNPQAANKNQSWTITVKPLGTGQIGITLPAGVSCTDDKSICTDDGRKLSHSTSATVQGPPSISVADARVQEADDAFLSFAVTLSRSPSSEVSVDYATSDGTAHAGADYTATSGRLTIPAGTTAASIDVPVLDDAHDDDDETLTLTLSNPTNAVLDDATATGTIDNNDAMPRALMARFGRTAAVHVIDQIEERIEAPRRPGFDGRIAGRNIDRNIGRDFALGFLRQLGGRTGYGGMARGRQAMPARAGQATGATHLMRPHGAGRAPTASPTPMGGGQMRPGAGPHQQNGMSGLGLGHGQMLTGSSFALNRGTKNGGVLSVWSRSAQSRFHGREGLLALNGDVVTSTVGADYAKGPMVSGVAVAHSRGTGGYSGEHRGAVSSAITGVYPWIGYEASERVSVWTVAGYGAGGLLLSSEAGSPIETGLSMAMAAGGGRGRIAGSERGFALAFKADALWVGTRSEQAHTAGGRLNGTTATVTRLRTALEGAKNVTLGERMSLRTTVETGIRQDGGDAETGAGIDVGAGLALNDRASGLTVNVHVRTLVVHQAAGFSERGVAVSISYDPAPASRLGFSARVSPAWGGDAMSGAEGLWRQETMSGMGQHRLLENSGRRLDTELAYGLPIGARFVGTPRAGVRTSEHGRDYRVGYGMQVLQRGRLNLQLGVDAERRVSPVSQMHETSGAADQRVLGSASMQW